MCPWDSSVQESFDKCALSASCVHWGIWQETTQVKTLALLRLVLSAGPSQLAAVSSPRDTCPCLEAFVESHWEGVGTLLSSSGSRLGLLLN